MLNSFLAKHSVRIVGVLGAIVPLLMLKFPHVPWQALAGLAAGVFGVGEAAQRREDAKTAAGWAAAEIAQAALTELESRHAAQIAADPAVNAAPVAADAPVVAPAVAPTVATPL